MASALDAIHARGIVHRDVKPANILLGREGAIKLADLGIALAADRTQITRDGMVLGTFSYMAPEQLEGTGSTPAVDIYALAVVAFEMLSGQKARPQTNPVALAHAIATQPPPDLCDVVPDIPRAAAEVLRRGMDPDPERRPRSATDLVDRLRVALAPEAGTLPVIPLVPRAPSAQPRPPAAEQRGAQERAAGQPVAQERAAGQPVAQERAGAAEARVVQEQRDAEGRAAEERVAEALAADAAAARARAGELRAAEELAGEQGGDTVGGVAKQHRLPPRAAEPPPVGESRDRRRRREGGPLGLAEGLRGRPGLIAGGVAACAAVVLALVLLDSGGGGGTPAKRTTGSATGAKTSVKHRSAAASTSTGAPATTTTGTRTTGSTVAGGTEVSANPTVSTPSGAVQVFYGHAASHDYAAAWALADPAFRSQLQGYASFASGQSRVRADHLPGGADDRADVAERDGRGANDIGAGRQDAALPGNGGARARELRQLDAPPDLDQLRAERLRRRTGEGRCRARERFSRSSARGGGGGAARVRSNSATHSMCGVWGNMSTGLTRWRVQPASTSWAAFGARVVGLQET